MSDQHIVRDQDLKNGLGSILEFVAEGIKRSFEQSPDVGFKYLRKVAKHIIDGEGEALPVPGPVTPHFKKLLGEMKERENNE